MADSESNPNPSSFSKHPNVIEIVTTSSNAVSLRRRIPQHCLLIWLDPYINESKQDYQNMLIQLRDVVSNLYIFNQTDECIDFLTDAHEEKVFLITDYATGKEVIPLINDIPKLDTIYILCQDNFEHERRVRTCTKLQDVYTDIRPICDSLQQFMKQTDQDSIAMSFVPLDQITATENLDQLEPLFMYTQLFKEVLLTMEYDIGSIKSFTAYCRNRDYLSVKNIDRFENEYSMHSPIWWYTFPSFIYEMLNSALRMLEAETMIEMGFFLCDLHNEIEKLYQQQVVKQRRESFIVYRGQGLSTSDFEKLLRAKNGLISFNNFLSTSEKYDICFGFAQIPLTTAGMVGILFKIHVDPTVSSIPFAFIKEMSYFQTEAEVLFSMHSIFRIGHIEKIATNRELYQVDLKLTADDDQELRLLTNRIRQETTSLSGVNRLCLLLIKIGKFDKAEDLCKKLLHENLDPTDEAYFYNNLAYLKIQQGDHENALSFQRRALTIRQMILPIDHPDLAISYNNLAFIYGHMGEYLKSVSLHEKVLEMRHRILPPDDPDLSVSYNNIGLVYIRMGEYSKALSSFEKANEIARKALLPNHPDLATSYGNIAFVYDEMGEYSKSISLHEKAIEIRQKSLTSDHPNLAISYNNIGLAYTSMGEYSKALLFFEKALEMRKKCLSSNHPDLAASYNDIALVYNHMGEYSKALSFFEQALEMFRKVLPVNHPHLGTTYNNVASAYNSMGQYSKALSFFEKAHQIQEKASSINHPVLATSYNNIALVYDRMREYSKALSFHEKALEMRQKSLPPNHPDLAASYNNIGLVYMNMKEDAIALSFFQEALDIHEETLSNHPDLATLYSNIASAYNNTGEYSKALSFHQKSLEIQEKILPPNHPDFGISYNNIASVYYQMKQWSEALPLFERGLIILQASLPSNHPDIKRLQNNIEAVKRKLEI